MKIKTANATSGVLNYLVARALKLNVSEDGKKHCVRVSDWAGYDDFLIPDYPVICSRALLRCQQAGR